MHARISMQQRAACLELLGPNPVPPCAPAHGQAAQQLVAQGLGLGDGAQTAVSDLLGVQLHALRGEVEALLDDGGQLADAAALLACACTRPGTSKLWRWHACAQLYTISHLCRNPIN